MSKKTKKVGKVREGTCKALANGACVCRINGKTSFKKKVNGKCVAK